MLRRKLPVRGTVYTTALALLFAAAATSLDAQGVQTFNPISTQTISPTTIINGPSGSPPDGEGPLHFEVGDNALADLKAEAEKGTTAPLPDQVLLLPEGNEPLIGFGGLSWDHLNPPDTQVAKSASRLIQMVNSQIGLYDNAGAQLQVRSMASFFGVPTTPAPPFDPRVIHDRLGANSRYFVVASQYAPALNGNPASSQLLLAVSRSADPTNLNASSWCHYRINTISDTVNTNPTFADYPMLGVGQDKLVISANHHFIVGGSFTYAVVRAINKTALANNASSCPSALMDLYRPSSTGGNSEIHALQPAVHATAPSSFAGTSNPVYLVSADRSASDPTYWIWRLRNAVGSGQLQMVALNTTPYEFPPNAKQPPASTMTLETGDSRILQTSGVGDSLWISQTVACNHGSGTNETCLRIGRLAVGETSGQLSASEPYQHVIGGGENTFLYFPGVVANQDQRTAVPFLISGTSRFLSSMVTLKQFADADYGRPQTLGAGNCGRNTVILQRTGDYVGAALDPNLTKFWVSAEYAAMLNCSWWTRIAPVD